ncbi:collagen alpha-6(VI) chain [Ambystoma mexicanum]|uniref:collagen alpha-6(VI) chain n=1 Tax=Ambystoma mexicanum TaxID=8296 RepID=UPI0037E77E98
MKKLTPFVFSFLLWINLSIIVESAPEYADVVFLVDSSDSMGDKPFLFVKMFLNRVLNNLPLGADKFRVALVQYNDDVHTEFQQTTYKAKNPMLNHLKRNVVFKGGSLKTGNALAKVHNAHFKDTSTGRDRTQFPQILVVITSGTSLDEVEQPALELQQDGVKIIAVGVQNASLANLQAMASSSDLVYQIPSAKELIPFSQSIPDLITNVAKTEYEVLPCPESTPGAITPGATTPGATTSDAVPDPSTTVPVLQPTTSISTLGNTTYVNDCVDATLADIVFMVDGSFSGDSKNFEHIKEFLNATISTLDVRDSCIRIGLVVYSNTAKVITSLAEHTKKDDVLSLVKDLSTSYDGFAYTGAAINFTHLNVFSDSKGSRKNRGVGQAAVLITRSSSNDSVAEAAQHLRRAGVTLFVIGIQEANHTQVTQIATHPPVRYTDDLKSFSDLMTLSHSFARKMLIEVQEMATASSDTLEVLETACVDTEEADIYLLIDGSGSISAVDFQDMKTFLVEVVEMFNIGPDTVRVAAVQYSQAVYISLEIKIDAYTVKKDLKLAIQNIRQLGGGTETGAALLNMLQLIKTGSNSRRSKIPRYLIVLTDGESTDTVKGPADQLRAEQVNIYAIGVKEANKTQLLEIAGKGERVHFVESFDSLKEIKNEVVRQICSNEACKHMEADIMFLVDGSGSIGTENFETMKTFMKELVQKSDIGITKVQVGAIQFSGTVKEEFQMNTFTSKSDIQSAISAMTALDQNTLTGEALKFVSDYFKPPKGGRRGLKQFLILITDGESQDAVKAPATTLREEGIIIYSVGVKDANHTQLEEISGKSGHVFFVTDFNILKQIQDELLLRICSPYQECKRIERADIVFVIDGSGSIQNHQYATMKEFMVSLVNRSDVGSNKVQFGALRYSDDPKILFSLNKHTSKSEVIEVIQNDRHSGGNTYTSKALRHSEVLFSEKSGSRRASGVPQILIVITDGESHDNQELNSTAEHLRNSGILIYAIGIKPANPTELLAIAGSEEKVFFVDNFDGLKSIYSNLSDIVCSSSPPECEVHKADIVFLIDGSTSISDSDFVVMKDFMSSVVAQFDTRPGMVHFGVAQFSVTYQDEFGMASSLSDSGIKNQIGGLQQMQGGTLIGNALRSVGRSLFTPRSGCRINEGIQQLLLVITDGVSQDKVAKAAEFLRKRSINIYAIGVGVVSHTQLLEIAGSPDKKFTVDNFSELNSIKKRIVRNICKEESISNCLVDVVVGFDISTQDDGESLLDGQTQLRERLPDILKQITSLSTVTCSLGTNTQASLALHVKNTVAPISSNFQIYSENTLKSLQALKVNGPSRLDASSMESLWATFQNKSAAQGKVIVVFTDGLDGATEELERMSEKLRKEGLSAFITVVLEGARDIHNIPHIEFGRGFGYRTQLTVGMHDVGRRLYKELSQVAEKKCCCTFCKCIGDEGSVGTYGKPGEKGRAGLKGHLGHSGEEGAEGERGHQGIQGEQGAAGYAGKPGHKGIRGMPGDKAENGEEGLDGMPGEKGAGGPKGHKGASGDPGYQGIPGTKGMPGESGEKGLRGDPGDAGIDGLERGPPGLKGDPGEKGDDGPVGLPGAAGGRGKRVKSLKGLPGPQGENGMPGLVGDPGAQGFPGPEGEKGVLGESGNKGNSGPAGFPGAFGPKGAAGIPGVPGPRGSKGQPGDPGVKGALGLPGCRGVQGDDGRDGYGQPGPKGIKGAEGVPGYSGSKGERGDSGLPGDAGMKGRQGMTSAESTPGKPGSPGSRGPPGRPGPKGEAGKTPLSTCDLIGFIRSKCRKSDCPVYPTELVFALDMSKDVTVDTFRKMKDIVLSVVGELSIREINCPIGARVAILSYNANSKYLVRFSDFHSRTQLLKAIRGIAFERSSGARHIGRTMRFVARNAFKRTLHGANVRKVAVLFSNGQSEDDTSIQTAVMEFSALDIVPVVIAFNSVPHVETAFKMDGTGKFQLLKVPARGDYSSLLNTLRLCTLCYDRCKPEASCHQDTDPPPKLGTDVVFLLDSSQSAAGDQLARARDLVSSLIDGFNISMQPTTSKAGDRVALVSLAAQRLTNGSLGTPHVEFDLLTYGSKSHMKRHLRESVHQLRGPPAIGHTLQWTIENMMLKAPQPRKSKILFVISAGETSLWDKETLEGASLKAKCQGYAILVVSMGPQFNNTELEDLVSHPVDHHLVQLGRVDTPDVEYAAGFIQPFLNALRRRFYKYPPAELRTKCARTRS